MSTNLIVATERYRTISNAIALWLENKERNSSSARTRSTYEWYITVFRQELFERGLDLDGFPTDPLYQETEEDKKKASLLLSVAAEAWASTATRARQKVQGVSSSTFNQRLAVLSSFYTFARKRGFLTIDNPIDLLDRRTTQEYAQAQPLTKEEVQEILQNIDRTTTAGKRDYALLLVFISTGRRASEVLALRWKHVLFRGGGITLHFERCKGGKEMFDQLEPRIVKALQVYLHEIFSSELMHLEPEQPIWLSFSHKRYKQQLTQRGLADIFQKRLSTMKIHTTRHTFAHAMDQSGARVTDIQARLGHSNVATTGRYLQQLKSAENKHASTLLDNLGVEE